MKVCSICLKCYDDSIETCPAEDRETLTRLRRGDCLVIEGYRIGSQIESDSPVVRFRATHLASGKNVFAKFIKSGGSASELEAEMRAAAELAHPNIARVFDFGEVSEDEFFVLSEETPGESLRCFLKKAVPLSRLQAIEITRQIAEGLEVIHSANLVHRAVSPENIFVASSTDGELSVNLDNIDFGGVAQKAVAEGAGGVDARTEVLRYFSPEQFAASEIDFRSDLYSLAVVFYELLLARSPYASIDPAAISEFVFDESDLKDLHLDLRALAAYSLREAFQQRVDLRPKTTNSFVRQLRHLELIATRAEGRMRHPASDLPKEKPIFEDKKPRENEFVRDSFDSNQQMISSIASREKNRKESSRPIESVPKTNMEMDLVPEFEVNKDDVSDLVSHVYGKEETKSEEVTGQIDDAIELDFEENTTGVRAEDVTAASVSSIAYGQTRLFGINRISLYVGGVMLSAIFGGIMTAGIIDWRNASITGEVAPKTNMRTKEKPSEIKTPEIVDMNDEEFEARRNQAKPESIENASGETATKISSVQVISNNPGTKKRQSKRRIKRKRKSRVKKARAQAVKSGGATRPRIVSNVVITH